MHKPASLTPTLTAMLVALALYGSSGALQTALAEDPAPPAATPETAAAETAPAAPVAEPETSAAETTPAASAAEPAVTEEPSSVRRSYGYRAEQNRRLAQIKEAARIRRDNMERWRSQRRWWNNPVAEDRRQWNKARSRWYRDMAEARRQQAELLRPDYNYRYRYWRGYP